jgi:hypothetical protein
MTQVTGAPNQETQVLQYINQGQYVRGALIKKGSQKHTFQSGITRISLQRVTWDWQELQF